MRRNALKNRKFSQTKKWRQHRLSGKHPRKQRRTLPLLSHVTLRDLRIRVRRHSVDFLLNCKDPTSKERALLHQLEEVKPDRPSEPSRTEVEKNNLKPLTLNSSMSAPQKSRTVTQGGNTGLNGKPVKVVERQAVCKRSSSRIRSVVDTTLTLQAGNTASVTAVCTPGEMDTTCSSVKHGAVDTESQSNSCSTESAAVDTQETRSVSSPAGDCPRVEDASQKAADSPLKSLRQYLTVSLTRLSVPHSADLGKSRQSERLAALTGQSQRRVSRSQQKQQGASENCTAEGNRGVREMFFKDNDKVNLRKRHASESAGDLSHSETGGDDRVIKIQTVSGEDRQKPEKTEGQREKRNAAPAARECKSRGASGEGRDSACKVVASEKPRGQNGTPCTRNKVKEACKEQTVRTVSKQPVSRQEEDIIIKQAKVLLSDILRKDESLIGKRLHGSIVGRGFSALASKEMQSAEGEEEQAEINGGRYHCSAQRRIMRQRKMRPRAVKKNPEVKQSTEGCSSQETPAAVNGELSNDSMQLPPSPQRDNNSPTTCLNPLPHESPTSAKATTSLQPDTNLQAHIQSNIPLKKRTFRSSVETDSEQGLNSVTDQTPKEGAEVNPSTEQTQEGLGTRPEEGAAVKKSKSRVRRTELQRLVAKKITTFNRGLRTRAEVLQGRFLRRGRKCKVERQDQDEAIKAHMAPRSDKLKEEKRAEDPADVQEQCGKNPTLKESPQKDGVETLIQEGDAEETKPGVNLKILFKRRKGRVWEMQGAAFEDMALKIENGEELVKCDPFKAIMDSVSVLNMEMEAAQAHVHASKKSKNRLHRLKKRGERLCGRQTGNFPSNIKADADFENGCGPVETPSDDAGMKEKLDGEPPGRVKLLPEKTESSDSDVLSAAGQETKVEDHFLKNCCLFESGSQQSLQPELDLNGFSLPVIKLRRKAEDIWEVDSNEELRQTDLKLERDVKKEKDLVFGKQKKGCFDFSKLKDECPSRQRPNSSLALKTEPPPFSLSLSPLSLSSPLNDTQSDVYSLAADAAADRPEMSSGGRKQRHKMERTSKCGPAETPTTCLSHTLQQIDNSLSRLSEGLCSSQTLEKPPACPAACHSVIQNPSQSPPFTSADNMLSGEPGFPNCCDDLLDFQCLNFEGYYQPQNMLPSSPSDLCSLDPPTDPFSSPLSHSPADTWTTETPYLGPPSPGNNFTSEDLQFFPGLISSKSDSAPLECEAKDTSKDRNPPNPCFSFAALSNSDLTAKDRIISKNPGLRQSREDLRTQPLPSVGKPRLFGPASSSLTSPTPVSLTQPSFNIRASTSQAKAQSCLKTQGPFHRMGVPSKSQAFMSGPPNAVRGLSQSCLAKSVPSSQTPNKFLSPQLFSVKNPNPPDNPFKFQTSTVIHRVLKFQGGNPSQNLYSAPCTDAMAAGSPTVTSRTMGAKSGAIEKTQQSQKLGLCADAHHKGNVSVQGFGKDVGHLSRPSPHFTKPAAFAQSFGKSKMSPDKHEGVDTNMTFKNLSALPRSFFPSKLSDSYSSPQERILRQDRPTSDKHQPCYAQQDPFDFSFGSSLSPMSQDNSPHVIHSTPPGTPAPAHKSQSSAAAASFPYGYQGPPYVLNFSGDHSLTLGLRDGAEGCPGLGSTNYTYHCLMEPSGTQGRLVLEPCGPQLSNPASFTLGGFSGLKGQDEHCRKDMQQQCQPDEHHGPPNYGPATTSHSMGATKPKRVRLVVTDGTVDLDLQYSD